MHSRQKALLLILLPVVSSASSLSANKSYKYESCHSINAPGQESPTPPISVFAELMLLLVAQSVPCEEGNDDDIDVDGES